VTQALISVRRVTKLHAAGTPREVRALDGVSFEVPRGAYVAIVGESGSGKTTLMHLLGALDRPSEGSIEVDGSDLSAASRSELQHFRATKIGFVFQGFNLISTLDALENVLLAARYARRPPAAARPRAVALLEGLGLRSRLHHRPAELSGGEQQRVAIARALVNEPALLLADEPTGELDSKTAAGVLDHLDRLHREEGQTIVVVTHSPAVWQRAGRVVRLADGKIETIVDA
jgi:ABC-type lipoprotein export system ATPase subunit